MKKTIITVVGNDTVGIIAKVCTYLAENNVNILDITQTIVQGYFNMMMVADTSASEKDAAALSTELAELGDSIGEMCIRDRLIRQRFAITHMLGLLFIEQKTFPDKISENVYAAGRTRTGTVLPA